MQMPGQTRPTLEQRFWSKVKKTRGCWPWQAYLDKDRYGRFRDENGKQRPAHRVSLRLSGIDIPKGMLVDHICRNTSCVNPKHLRVVTPRINTIENSLSIQAMNAAKTHCKRGHPFTVRSRSDGNNPTRRVCTTCMSDNQKAKLAAETPRQREKRLRKARAWHKKNKMTQTKKDVSKYPYL